MAEINENNELLHISNELERERIIFLQGILEKDAKKLSDLYPNLVIFSAGDQYNKVIYSDNNSPITTQLLKNQYDENAAKPDIGSSDIILGSYIFKNGVKYNIIRGVHPQHNRIHLNTWEISLSIDRNGLLKLNIGSYEPRYFYVGAQNPLDATHPLIEIPSNVVGPEHYSPIEDPNIVNRFLEDSYRTSHAYNNHNDDKGIIMYQGFEDIFSNYFTRQQITCDENINQITTYGIDNHFRDFDIADDCSTNGITDLHEVYILMPVEYESLILPSNTLMLKGDDSDYELPENKFKLDVEPYGNPFIMDDGNTYKIFKVNVDGNFGEEGYKRIRIYKINNN